MVTQKAAKPLVTRSALWRLPTPRLVPSKKMRRAVSPFDLAKTAIVREADEVVRADPYIAAFPYPYRDPVGMYVIVDGGTQKGTADTPSLCL